MPHSYLSGSRWLHVARRFAHECRFWHRRLQNMCVGGAGRVGLCAGFAGRLEEGRLR